MNSPNECPKIVVSLGTDHHKFNRLVDWVDDWIEQRNGPVDCLVQHGFSRVPRSAKAVDRMPRAELLSFYEKADVVLVQGGPGSILDARKIGQIPIAVPRRPELHEVVDGHQIAFTEAMVRQGDAIMVESFPALVAELERVIADPASVVTPPRVARPDLAASNLEAAILAAVTDTGGHWRQVVRRTRQMLELARG